jgi:molybdopterin converting factor small subunit
MAITIRIPTALRKLAGGLDRVPAEAGTVREVIAALGVSHPALAAQLLDEAGNLRSFINLYANEDSIKELNGLDTVLKSGDDLSIVPAIAGG